MEDSEAKLETIDKVFRDDPNDDRPLGGGNKFSIPEFAEGEGPPADMPPPKRKPVNSNRLATKNKPKIDEDLTQQETQSENNQKNNAKENLTKTDQAEEKLEDGFEFIEKPIRNDINDERPLGGGKKFSIPEFEDGTEPPEVKPKPKAIPKRFQAKIVDQDKNGSENQDATPTSKPVEKKPTTSSTKADKPQLNNKAATASTTNNDTEIIESASNNDEKPIGGKGAYNFEDERPVGGGNKSPFNAEDERPIGGGKKNQFTDEANANLEDERPIGGGSKKTTFNPDDERPVGSNKSAFNPDDERPLGGAKKNNIMDEDERPVGGGTSSNAMSEYPEGMDPDSVQGSGASKDEGPLSKRIVSKILKTRMTAFQELAQEFETKKKDAGLFSEYDSDWDKRISDVNPSVQEQACNALKNWISFNPGFKTLKISDTASVLKALIEKCIASGKPQVLAVSKEVLCLLYEKNNDQGEFFEALNACVKNKNAKVACAGIQSITDLMNNYGAKKFEFMKPFFGEIEKQSLSTNSSIRSDCMAFFKEAMKWLGDQIVKNYTKNLKKLQQDELDKFYADWDKQPMVPLRASEDEKKQIINKSAVAGAGGSGSGGGAAGGGDLDLYEIVDAVDIFVKYSEKWCDKVKAMAKWQEKKEQLDEIITAASQAKVAPNNYMPVVAMIKLFLNDNNSNVQLNSIKLTGCLCKSIRKGFNLGAKQLFDQIIIKFRDKKTLIIEETKTTIDCFWYAVTLEEVMEEIKESLQDKAPPMKMQVMQALERYFDARPNATKSRDAFKQACIPTIKKLFDDSNSEIREYCLKLIGKFNKQKDWFTAEEINNLTSGLNEQKKAKISQGSENNDKTDAGASKPGAKQSTAASKPPVKPQEDEEEVKDNKSSLSSTLRGGGIKKATGDKAQADKSDKTSGGGGGAAMNDEDVSSSSIPTADDCEEKLKDNGMPDEYTKIFAGTKNPEKVEALQAIYGSDYFDKCLLEVLVYLDKVTFKSSILVVLKEILVLIENATNSDNFNKKCFHVITDFIIKNIGDAKFNEKVQCIIEKSCERLIPKYVLSRLIRVLKQDEKKMSPKSAQELSKTIAKVIDLATLKHVNFMDVLQFAKESIQNTNVSIKAGGQEILKKLYEHMGETLTNTFLKDIPANVMGTLSKEFAKLTVLSDSDKNSNATMKFVGEASKEVTSAAGSGKGGASFNPLDSLPRADISKDAEKIIKKLQDGKWQTRKEGLDELDKILSKSNNRIQITGLFDLLAQLKQTLQESNKGVQRQAFNFIGRFAEACGKDLRNHSKNFVCQIVSNLSSKESLMRKEVVQALDRFEKAIGGENIVNVMATSLTENNPELRQGIIEWILRHPESYASADLNAFVQPILLCLDDKSKEIRVLAEQLLEKTISVTTAEPFKFAFKDMKPATVKTIQPIIAKYTNLDDDSEPAPTPTVTRKDNKSTTQIIQKPGDKNPPKIIVAGQKPAQGTGAANTQGSKTLVRNATTMNLKVKDENSDTASNNGDRTPIKSKYGLNHSASTNKLNPKQETAQTNAKSNFQQGSQQNLSQTQIEDYQPAQEKVSINSMNSSQINYSNRPSSMVEPSAKRATTDDSMIFPLQSQIASLKQKRFNFPLYQRFDIQNPSNEHFEFIENELKFLLSNSITSLMFSFNYKSLIQATVQIKNACDEEMEWTSLKYLSDLLFQWCYMRIYGNFNTEVCIHLLDTIRTILNTLSKINETLSDLEIGTINACIRECLINLPEISSVLQQIYVITNIQIKILGNNRDKAINFWMNQLILSVGSLHPQYFESDTLNLEAVQNDFQNKIYDLLTKVFVKNINPQSGLAFLSSIPFKTPKAITFILAVQEQFGRDTMIQAGFASNALDSYAEQNKQNTIALQSPGFPNHQSFNHSIYNNISNQQKQSAPAANSNNASSQINSASGLDQINSVDNITPKSKNTAVSIQNNGVKLNETPSFTNTSSTYNVTTQQQLSQQNSTQSNLSSQKSTQQVQQKPLSQQQQQQPQQQQQQQPSLEEIFVGKVKSLKKDPYSNEKIEMLVYINNIIQEHDNQAYAAVIESSTNLLLEMIYSQLKFCFENKKQISPQYLSYFLNVMYKCFTIKNFAKNCQFEPLKNFTEEILYRLLAEDENQNKDEAAQNSTSGIIKLINSTMLRILENSRPEYVYKILLELLIKYRQQFNYAKILGLIIKCILKVTKGLGDFINQIDLGELLLYFHSYICEFLVPNPSMSDDIGVKTIKTILKELCKLKQEAIWDVYNSSIKNCPQKDQFISEWIGLVLKPAQSTTVAGNPISIVSPRDLRFERKISATQQSLQNISQEQIDQQIIKIIQNIKQTDTFEQGIAQLHEILTKYPTINIEVYLQDCTQNFTKFVINNLEKYDQQKKVSGLAGLSSTSQLYNAAKNYQQQIPYDDRSDDKNSSGSYGIEKPMDYQNLHNRINEFKQRIIKRDQQYNELESISQQNYQSQQGDKSYQPKSTEEFMQKVIDMKTKRANQQISQSNIKGLDDDQANSSFSSNKQNF